MSLKNNRKLRKISLKLSHHQVQNNNKIRLSPLKTRKIGQKDRNLDLRVVK